MRDVASRGPVGGMPRASLGLAALACAATFSGACNKPSDAELFSLHCARCHDEDGSDREELRHLGQNLDLNRSTLIRNRKRGLIYRRIAWGWGAMPGFSGQLAQPDLDRLVSYTLTIPQEEP